MDYSNWWVYVSGVVCIGGAGLLLNFSIENMWKYGALGVGGGFAISWVLVLLWVNYAFLSVKTKVSE